MQVAQFSFFASFFCIVKILDNLHFFHSEECMKVAFWHFFCIFCLLDYFSGICTGNFLHFQTTGIAYLTFSDQFHVSGGCAKKCKYM